MRVGQKVICNGFPGTIVEVCGGQLNGMVVVRLERGPVCVDISDVETPLINHVDKIETYKIVAANGKCVRRATKVTFSDGFEVKFADRIPSKTDAINQAIAYRLAQVQ